VERDGPRSRTPEDAIGHRDVKVQEAAERPIEALDEGHRARLAARVRRLLLPARDLLDENAAARGERVRTQREDAARSERLCFA
jgi:hypothetical protein